MNRRQLHALMNTGDGMTSTLQTTYRTPVIPTAIDDYVTAKFVEGAVKKMVLTFDGLEVTVADATVGVGTKILDFPLGLFKIVGAYASLQFTTTSVLADTLNASKTINWAIGTATQTTSTLAGTAESDIIPVVSATSSATVDTANTATIGEQWNEKVLDGASTAADLYLNISVPTATDIDANATVEIDGTVTILYMDLGVTSALTNASRLWSASIWKNCPWDEIQAGQVDGHVYFNEFTNNVLLANNQAATNLGDGIMGATAATAGTTINQVVTGDPTGIVKLESTSDNEDAIIAIGGGSNVVGQYIFKSGMRLWMEARISLVNITDSKFNAFCGFAEEGLCATTALITASDAMADKDYIGFQRVFADGDKLDVVHNTAGGGGATTAGADACTIVADTFTKVGIYCDGTSVFFYQDGTLVDTVLLSATNFPDGEEMAFYLGLMLGHADTASVSVDWVRIAQQRA